MKYTQRCNQAAAITKPFTHIPYIGKYVRDFWYLILTEGVWSTIVPRWGGITFSYLNDGMGATVWHTWNQMTTDNSDPYNGIYIYGAPRSRTHAIVLDRLYKMRRDSDTH